MQTCSTINLQEKNTIFTAIAKKGIKYKAKEHTQN